MRDTKCELIRRELDELRLGDEAGVVARQHLRDCGECREFHQQQIRLRQIVGSLGTVQAPPDFDFRLRARLANESSNVGFHLRAFQWSPATKGFAAAAMLLVFVGGVVYVRTVVNRPAVTEIAVQNPEPAQPTPSLPAPAGNKVIVPEQTPVVAVDNTQRRVQRGGDRPTSARPKRNPVAIDFSSERAPVLNTQRQSAIFPIDASFQSFTVSLDDGEGNARTISLPTISFGSQKVLTNTNRNTPKGVW
jgi:hypothetical protein